MRRTVLLSLLVLGGCFGTKTPPEPAVSDGGTSGSSATAPSEGAVAPVLPAALTEEQKAIARREKAKEATALLTTGKFEDARRAQSLLEELKAELPESAELAYNLGLAHEQLGNRAMAEQAYRSATQLDPELGAAWLKLGSLAEGNGDPSWALTVYGQGMRAAPTDMDLHVARIGVLVRQGRLADAEAAAKEALAINANAQSIYSNLALIYIKQGKLELGKFIINRAYEKALELDPELLDAMLFLSEVHLDNRAYGAMVPLLEKAVAVDPDDPAIHMNLGIGYRGLGRFEEAEQEYRKVIELLPGRSEPYLNLVILYGDHQKKYDEAMQLLEQYKGMAGADPAIAEAWALQYEKEKEKAARLEARRQRAEERRKKREEEQRFLEEFERKKKEEEERQRQLEAQQAAEAAEAAAAGGTAAPVGTEAPPPAGTEPAPAEPVEPAAGGEVAPAGTDAAQPVSEPVDSTSAPAAPSEPAPGASSEDAAGQTGEGDASEPQPAPSPENPWGG
jgi:Flp pilus assembly protein TadD